MPLKSWRDAWALTPRIPLVTDDNVHEHEPRVPAGFPPADAGANVTVNGLPWRWHRKVQEAKTKYSPALVLGEQEPTKGGAMITAEEITTGPNETLARQMLGNRPDEVSEADYLYAVREFVDMLAIRQAQWAEQVAKGGKR